MNTTGWFGEMSRVSKRCVLFGLALIGVCSLVGCGHDLGLQRFPTAAPYSAPTPSPTPTETPSPTASPLPGPLVTAPPAVVLPDATGTSVACAANTLRLPIVRPSGGEVGAVSRILALGDWLYLLVDGELYRLRRLDVDAGLIDLEPVLVSGEQVAGRPVQELADLAVNPTRNLIYAFDKAGHVFSYEAVSGLKTLSYRATPGPDDEVDPQIVAIEVDSLGRLILLDSTYGALLTPDGMESLTVVSDVRGMASGRDVAAAGGRLYVLRHSGEVRVVQEASGWLPWYSADNVELGLSLKTSSHLGVEVLYLVDGLQRRVTGITPDDAREVTRQVFSFPDMGLLRDIVFAGGRLYAVADSDLYVYPGPASEISSVACPPPGPGSYARPKLYGVDVLSFAQGMTFPIEDGTLPVWPRVYPGASRLYRMGVHYGLDIYYYDAPRGFKQGWPVVAISGGEVVRATLLYNGLTKEEFEAMIAEAESLGATPPETLTKLAGRHIIIEHGDDIRTVYMHLDKITPGVVTGVRVQAGQVIGNVGVTGTRGEVKKGAVGVHLHAEIWVGDRYLGQGITIRETMWWFEQLFGES